MNVLYRISLSDKIAKGYESLSVVLCALYYVPLLGLFLATISYLISAGLMICGARRGTMRQGRVIFGGILCSVLYLMVFYFEVSRSITREYPIELNRGGDYYAHVREEMTKYLKLEALIYWQLFAAIFITFLRFIARIKKSELLPLQGGIFGVLFWVFLTDLLRMEDEYGALNFMPHDLGGLAAWLLWFCFLPVFFVLGIGAGVKYEKKKLAETTTRSDC